MHACVPVFFITSSDSRSLVIDSITLAARKRCRPFKRGAVSTGLPFTALLPVMCVSLYMGLRRE